MLQGPDCRNRSPQEIITQNVYFDSVGYTYRSLSWLDFAKQEQNVCALHYAAHDIRQAIEQLFFEEIFFSTGTKLKREDYEKCKGNSTQLYKIIRKLNPHYEKLVKFNQAVFSADPNLPRMIIWDTKKLKKYSGNVSYYLHWAGEPSETVDNSEWFNKGIEDVEVAAHYIRETNLSGVAGIMMPDTMPPEIRDAWEKYSRGDINIDDVRMRAQIALPILTQRL